MAVMALLAQVAAVALAVALAQSAVTLRLVLVGQVALVTMCRHLLVAQRYLRAVVVVAVDQQQAVLAVRQWAVLVVQVVLTAQPQAQIQQAVAAVRQTTALPLVQVALVAQASSM